MASRSSRKRGKHRPAPALAASGAGSYAPEPDEPATRAQRTEAKNQAVRDTLEPLAPGERPRWVTFAAVLAAAVGLLNVVLYAAGVGADGATFSSTVGVGVILLVCAAGMWRAQYWAVLAFEVALGICIVYGGLSLAVASTWSGAIRSTIVFVVGCVFFYKLVRAMARLQMPQRP